MTDEIRTFAIGNLVGIVMSCGILLAIGNSPEQINSRWRADVIKNGAGHWTVTDDGKPEFKWGPK